MTQFAGLRRHFDSDMLASLKWQYVLNIGMGVLGAAFLLALGRALGPAQFGVYALCTAVPAVAVAILDARLQEFVLYIKEHCEKAAFPKILCALYWLDLFGKMLVIIFSTTAYFIMTRLGYSGLYLDYVALAALLIFSGKCFSGPSLGVLRCYGQLEFFSIMQVADWLVRLLALGALFASDRLTIGSAIGAQIAIAGGINLVVMRRSMGFAQLSNFDLLRGASHLPGLLKESGSIIFANQAVSAMDSVVKELDVIVSGVFLSTPAVGTYKIAKSLAGIAWRLADPIYIVVLPKLANLHAQKLSEELSLFTRHLALVLVPAAALLYGASVLGVNYVGPLVVGGDYLAAVKYYPLAAAWIVIALPLVWTHSLAIASGRPLIQFLAGCLGNGLGLLALCLGAAYFGVRGALTGLSLAYCLPFVFSFFFLQTFGVIQWRRVAGQAPQ